MKEYIEREALKNAFCASCSTNKRYHRTNEECRSNTDSYGNGCFKMRLIDSVPAADVVERKRGEWVLEAHKEMSNYGWNVTAECPECRAEKKLVWRGLFPNFCDALAKELALDNAKYVKLSNFCPNCGADMRGEKNG